LAASSRILSARAIHLVGHRVVHGADRYVEAAVVDDALTRGIEQLEELAPLHNVGAVSVIRAVRAALGNAIPEIAVFDTAFHRTMPDRARFYAIPWELTQRYSIKRFGFHGISHNYLTLRYAELTGTPLEQTNIITLHLEGGSSAAVVIGGRCVDTSMGFTPLEGLMMSTRSGDIDPTLVGFLARKENIEVGDVEKLLNKKSGLLGVSGRSEDTRELVAHQSEERVNLALEMFAYRVRKCIGSYLAAAGKISAIVFAGGIGENTPEVRRRICEGLEWFGLDLDTDRNLGTIDCEGRITRDGSRLHAFVIPTEEGLMIAHQALLCSGNDLI
jgi:acetate kinase